MYDTALALTPLLIERKKNAPIIEVCDECAGWGFGPILKKNI